MLLVACTTAIFAQTQSPSKSKKEHTNTAKVKYTCPMHPDVTSTKAGKCPKCGTQLVVQRTGSKQSENITYTCPMHPDVVSDTAGTCSICGMTLVEKKVEKSSKTKM